MKDRLLSTTYLAIADYAVAMKHAPIKDTVYHVRLDDAWEFWVNATTSPAPIRDETSMEIKPYECYVTPLREISNSC